MSYVVVRHHPAALFNQVLDGVWFAVATEPAKLAWGYQSGDEFAVVATRTDRFERRDCDGAVARVFEVQP